MEIWTKAQSHNLPVDIIFMDYAEAFDTVSHERLLAQLATLGIRRRTLNWIRVFFFTGREQRVTVNGALWNWCIVTSDVPQGCVLFTMFV